MKSIRSSAVFLLFAFCQMATLHGQPTKSPVVVGKFEANPNDTTFVIVEDKDGNVEARQITLMIDVPRTAGRDYDFKALFDITNNAKTDLRVVRVFADVKRFQPLPKLVSYVPLSGLKPLKSYFVLLDKRPSKYPANIENNKLSQVLRPSELDVIALSMNSAAEGVYDIDIVVEYSTGGEVGQVIVGRIGSAMFVNRDTAFALDRGSDFHVSMVQQFIRESKTTKYWLRERTQGLKR